MKCPSYNFFFETVSPKIRLRIIELLEKKPLSVTEMCDKLGEEQSKVSHSLKKLTECHFLDVKREGKNRIYSLNKDTIVPLMNLVSNSRDAMPEGGLLLLTSESFRINNKFVSARGFGKPGMYALIAVSDTGIGIDEISMEKIFEPFYTSKEIDKGTGLGLSIVYGIIKQHKGYIDVDSEPEKGTTVKIYLPMIETGKDKNIRQIEDVIPRGGRETILLVEDNSMTRQFLTSELTEFGYRLIVAEDGEEALYKFREHKDDIQFLITDVIMPKKSGKEVYEAIKRMSPDIKALFLSAYSEEMLQNEIAFIKGINFMSKPVKPYDLLRKIREILDE